MTASRDDVFELMPATKRFDFMNREVAALQALNMMGVLNESMCVVVLDLSRKPAMKIPDDRRLVEDWMECMQNEPLHDAAIRIRHNDNIVDMPTISHDLRLYTELNPSIEYD